MWVICPVATALASMHLVIDVCSGHAWGTQTWPMNPVAGTPSNAPFGPPPRKSSQFGPLPLESLIKPLKRMMQFYINNTEHNFHRAHFT